MIDSTMMMVIIIGSIIALDVTIFGNFMISRPVIVGTIIGIIFNNIRTGFLLGLIFEMLWSNVISVGAAIPFNSTIFTIITLSSIFLSGTETLSHRMFIIIVTIPIVYGYRQFETIIRLLNSIISHKIDKCIEKGKEISFCLNISIYIGISIYFVFNVLFLLLFIPIIVKFTKVVFFKLPNNIIVALGYTYYLLPILGFAVIFSNLLKKSTLKLVYEKIIKNPKRKGC